MEAVGPHSSRAPKRQTVISQSLLPSGHLPDLGEAGPGAQQCWPVLAVCREGLFLLLYRHSRLSAPPELQLGHLSQEAEGAELPPPSGCVSAAHPAPGAHLSPARHPPALGPVFPKIRSVILLTMSPEAAWSTPRDADGRP